MAKVQFLYGDYGTGKSTYILEKIKEDCQNKIPSFLLVPEQQTVIKERQIASLLPSAQLWCEVTNFTRLPDKIFREYGGLKDNYVTASAKNLLMYRAICDCRSKGKLKSYKIEEKHEKSSIKTFLQTIGEFKSYCVSMQKLDKAIDDIIKANNTLKSELEGIKENEALKKAKLDNIKKNDALRAKLEDLLAIWEAYEYLLTEVCQFSDPYDNMTMLAEKIEDNDYFKGANVYIDSFYGFSEAQLNVIEKIINSASKVTFAFDCPYEATKKNTIQFSMVAKTAKNVQAICKEEQLEPPICLKDDKKHKKDDMKLATKYIWDFTKKKLGESENIVLAKCSDEFEECEYVSSEICKLIMEKDYKYSEIAIIARNTSSYLGILDYTLKKYKIPHFLSSPTEWLTKPLLKMIFSALSFVDSHRREDLITFAKSGYINVDPTALADFESYIYSWDIYGSKFSNDDYWKANPDGFAKKFTELQEIKRTNALNTRDLLLGKLDTLEKVFSRPAKVKELCNAVFKFLHELEIIDALEEERKKPDKANAYVISQIWEAILNALDTLVDICGDCEIDATTFSTLFHYSFLDAKVGTIPTGEDNVIIADAHSIRAENIRHVFILGANEGVFPATVVSNSLFSDADKKTLKDDFNITLSPKNEERADDELMFFKTSLAIASEGAHICALTTGIDGSARQMSIGYKRIEELFEKNDPKDTKEKDKIEKVDVSKSATINKIYTKEIANEYLGVASDELKLALERELDIKAEEKSENENQAKLDFSNETGKLSEDTVKKLFGDNLMLSQTQIFSFNTCKFKYYSEEHLKLKNDNQYFFSSLDSGTLVHNVLEFFIKKLINNPKETLALTTDEIKKEVDMLVGKHIESVCTGVYMSNRLRHHFERLRRNLYIFVEKLVWEFNQSSFKPIAAELSFGKGKNDVPPISFELKNGKTVTMIGKADRVDAYRPEKSDKVYFRIADYKIGKKIFNEKNIEDKAEVQLLLYLHSIWKMDDCEFKKKLLNGATELVPAGYFYIPLNIGKLALDEDLSGDVSDMELKEKQMLKTQSAFEGHFLKDDSLILAQDKAPGTYLLPSLGSSSKYISLDKFEKICEKTIDKIINISTDIYSGRFDAEPKNIGKKKACEDCSQRAFCRRRSK